MNFPAVNAVTKQPENNGPVFVLTASRSGSTLLRFVLDGHPDIACPPETSIASACGALAHSWDVVEHAGSGSKRKVSDPIKLSPSAVAAIRAAIDRLRDHYLSRRGKRRWCDKSLDTCQFADIVAQVYPDARFICLFRHCMDVVASGVEACPWGVSRFGFDPFAAQYPGNSVAAIASYWLTYAQLILDFTGRHPELCHVVRYEDLVTAPEETVAGIFSFLGVEPVPGITELCFRSPHESEGPGDEKIWFTSGVSSGSMGRGVAVPARALPPPLREAINEMLAKLDYRQIDDEWNTALTPIDPRMFPDAQEITAAQHVALGHPEVGATARAIAARLGRSDEVSLCEINARWPGLSNAAVMLIVQSADGYREEIQVNLGPGARAGDAPAARIIAAPGTWHSLLDGGANLITEVTSGRVRCINARDVHRIRSNELHAVATLLGLAPVPLARRLKDAPAARPAEESPAEPARAGA